MIRWIGSSRTFRGIKLKVRAEDAERSEILNEPIPEMLDVEAWISSSRSVRGPMPMSFHRVQEGMTCSACGNEWEEQAVAVIISVETGLAPSPLTHGRRGKSRVFSRGSLILSNCDNFFSCSFLWS